MFRSLSIFGKGLFGFTKIFGKGSRIPFSTSKVFTGKNPAQSECCTSDCVDICDAPVLRIVDCPAEPLPPIYSVTGGCVRVEKQHNGSSLGAVYSALEMFPFTAELLAKATPTADPVPYDGNVSVVAIPYSDTCIMPLYITGIFKSGLSSMFSLSDLNTIALPEGTFTLYVSAPGYKTFHKDITITTGTNDIGQIILEPLPAGYGELALFAIKVFANYDTSQLFPGMPDVDMGVTIIDVTASTSASYTIPVAAHGFLAVYYPLGHSVYPQAPDESIRSCSAVYGFEFDVTHQYLITDTSYWALLLAFPIGDFDGATFKSLCMGKVCFDYAFSTDRIGIGSGDIESATAVLGCNDDGDTVLTVNINYGGSYEPGTYDIGIFYEESPGIYVLLTTVNFAFPGGNGVTGDLEYILTPEKLAAINALSNPSASEFFVYILIEGMITSKYLTVEKIEACVPVVPDPPVDPEANEIAALESTLLCNGLQQEMFVKVYYANLLVSYATQIYFSTSADRSGANLLIADINGTSGSEGSVSNTISVNLSSYNGQTIYIWSEINGVQSSNTWSVVVPTCF